MWSTRSFYPSSSRYHVDCGSLYASVCFRKLIKSTVTGFVSWFRWRPLKPLPQLRTSQDSKLEDYELRNQARVVVTVISGLNIPVRLSNKSEEVAAFVEAEYNGFTARTATSQGPHPTWNEMLTLPLEPTHLDYLNPNSLNGTITLNIFDEGDTVLSKFSGMKSRDWLGCVQIPLSAVCFNGVSWGGTGIPSRHCTIRRISDSGDVQGENSSVVVGVQRKKSRDE
jgi:hypothetical protein